MGGGGGSIYTAYTFYLDLDCKLDEGRLLNRLCGGLLYCWTAPEKIYYNLCICFTPWRADIEIIHPMFTNVNIKIKNILVVN
jgi:hypothetical protein